MHDTAGIKLVRIRRGARDLPGDWPWRRAYVVVRHVSERWRGLLSAGAGGMMISASVFSLAVEALGRGSVWEVIAGLLAGAAFFSWTDRMLEENRWHVAALRQADSREAAVMVIAMFIHSIPEGLAIGVGYATSEIRFGFLLALAIAVHSVPEGIAVTIPLHARKVSLW